MAGLFIGRRFFNNSHCNPALHRRGSTAGNAMEVGTQEHTYKPELQVRAKGDAGNREKRDERSESDSLVLGLASNHSLLN